MGAVLASSLVRAQVDLAHPHAKGPAWTDRLQTWSPGSPCRSGPGPTSCGDFGFSLEQIAGDVAARGPFRSCRYMRSASSPSRSAACVGADHVDEPSMLQRHAPNGHRRRVLSETCSRLTLTDSPPFAVACLRSPACRIRRGRTGGCGIRRTGAPRWSSARGRFRCNSPTAQSPACRGAYRPAPSE